MSCPVLPTGLGEDYWSMEDILAGQERIPCKIEQTLYRLGFLSTHSGEEHLVPGTKMEVPLWLARSLCTRRRQVISVSLPKSYREGMRVALSADANVVNLYRNGPYYYAVGISLLNFDLPERGDLAKCLLEVCLLYLIPMSLCMYVSIYLCNYIIQSCNDILSPMPILPV